MADSNLKPTTRRAASIAAVALFATYTLSTWASVLSETCTQGGTDGHFAGLVVGAPLALFALALLWRSRDAQGWPRYLRWLVLAGVAVLLRLLVPWTLSATIEGHHPCGAKYDAYLQYARGIDRFVPLLHLVLTLAAASLVLGPIRMRRHAA